MNEVDNFLAHYGVKGMKWGVRRYQNKDGTLNLRGLKKYGEKRYTAGEEVNFSSKRTQKLQKNAAKAKAVVNAHKTSGSTTPDKNRERAIKNLKEADRKVRRSKSLDNIRVGSEIAYKQASVGQKVANQLFRGESLRNTLYAHTIIAKSPYTNAGMEASRKLFKDWAIIPQMERNYMSKYN